jgi:glycosyltransferase involved in cell wall biosynthesis
MKILFSPCHYVFDEYKRGSEFIWAYKIADYISIKNTDSVVITGYKNILSEKVYRIIEVQKNKNTFDMSIINTIIFALQYFYNTTKILKKEKFDIIHHVLPFAIGHTFNTNFIFNKKNKLVIGPIQNPLSICDSDINSSDMMKSKKNISLLDTITKNIIRFVKPILNFLSYKTLEKANVIIVINEYTKNILTNMGLPENKIKIIPPGIDVDKFKYIPFKNKSKDRVEILVVCYLLKRKRVDLVIKAIKNLVNKGESNFILRIIGDGPQKASLEQLAKDLQLTEFIIFEGLVNNNEVGKYYKHAHIFINMSEAEGFATICLEAMSSGLAIISSEVGGFSDAIKHGYNGFLVKQGDVESLAHYIAELIGNPNLIDTCSKNARLTIEKEYDWQKCIIPKYLHIYSSLLK